MAGPLPRPFARPTGKTRCAVVAAALGLVLAVLAPSKTFAGPARLDRPPEDEIIYFVLPDRFDNADPDNDTGGWPGGRLNHGFDPTHKGFYHGGDLKGLTRRLDYIQGLGATALWLGPIYKNRPVQGAPGQESAGYHGYWITDFTAVDPHFGTVQDLKALITAAHQRGMKVFLDIITNHTADVIAYRECHDPAYQGPDKPQDGCPYRSKANFPFTTKGGPKGPAINGGFLGDGPAFRTRDNFAKLVRPDYAYTPVLSDADRTVKVPAWLNDVGLYHNRGETTFEGESSRYGDFAGLDDLMTEHPRVVDGFIEIFRTWIKEFRVDGFRIDTAKHVNPGFWRAFLPAMLAEAQEQGILNFYIFGEVYDPDPVGLARPTRIDGFPTVLDFAFQKAVADVIVDGAGTDRFDRLFQADALYDGGEDAARRLPTFLGNHDMGRLAGFLRRAHPDLTDGEMIRRLRLAHALMAYARGVPVIYYGDEQGFVSDGNDQDAREDMFPSKVAVYNDNVLVGTSATTAEDNFDPNHPLYRAIAEINALYHAHTPLRRGRQVLRLTEKDGGLFAFSRIDGETEILVVLNLRDETRKAHVDVGALSRQWSALAGACAPAVDATGSYPVTIGGLETLVCRSSAD
ncbi:MAG: alpha-amylase family glycosyl hydrolase [Alphaproteobacteria bacterium]